VQPEYGLIQTNVEVQIIQKVIVSYKFLIMIEVLERVHILNKICPSV